jgi:hypothetical protein
MRAYARRAANLAGRIGEYGRADARKLLVKPVLQRLKPGLRLWADVVAKAKAYKDFRPAEGEGLRVRPAYDGLYQRTVVIFWKPVARKPCLEIARVLQFRKRSLLRPLGAWDTF